MINLTNKQMIDILEELGIEVEGELENYITHEYNNTWLIDGDNYLIVTENEAYQEMEDYVEDNLWSFTTSFLSNVTGLDEEIFKAIQSNNRCEGNNDAIKSLLEFGNISMHQVAMEAIAWDGVGHFLAGYDGNEIEVYSEDETIFLYKN